MALNDAWQLWNGKELYTDIVEYVPPGAAYGVFAAWKLFGAPSYVSAKLLSIGLFLLSAVSLYRVVRRLTGRADVASFSIFGWLFAVQPLINHNLWSSFFAVVFLDALLVFFDRWRTKHALVVGFFAGAVTLTLHTKGIALLAAALFSVFLFEKERPWKERVINTASIIAAWGLTVGALFLRWSPAVLFDSLIAFPFRAAYLSHTVFSLPVVLLELGIVALMAAAAIRFRDRRVGVLALVQGAVFLSAANLIDWYHLLFNLFPLVAFVGIFAWRLRPRWFEQPLVTAPAFSAAVLAATFFAFFFAPTPVPPFERSIYYLDIAGHERPGFFSSQRVLAARHIYSGPFMPGLYFELRKPNPFPASNLLLCDSECQERMLGVFMEVNPEFAFLSYHITDRFGYNRDNPLDAYVHSVYRVCEEEGSRGFFIYARNECP